MRNAEFGAEHIADAVARTHRHATGKRAHRKPRANLAIEASLKIRWIRLHSFRPLTNRLRPRSACASA